MIADDFRLYNAFKPIKVEERNYILFFNGDEHTMERKLREYPTFIPWAISKPDFKRFTQQHRVYFIEKLN
jgi:hypothetical protein